MTIPESRREFRRRLQMRLEPQLPRAQALSLLYHIGDLYDAFNKSIDLLNHLVELESDSPEHRKTLAALTGELLDHIPSHLAEVGADLESWRDKVYQNAEKRGLL